MGEDGEAACGELRPGEADEQDVLEHAAAEGDSVEPGSVAEIVGDLGDEAGDRDVEAGRDGARRTTVRAGRRSIARRTGVASMSSPPIANR